MKRVILAISLVTVGLLATTDFSQLSTEELIALRGTVAVEDRDAFRTELQSRLNTMTPQERALLTASRQATSNGSATANRGVNVPTFESIDRDGDGKITQEELDTFKESRIEANSADGKLLQNIGNAPDLSSIDTNGDGVIDATEFQTYQSSHMKSASSSKSSQLNQGHKDMNSIGSNIQRGNGQKMGGHGRH